MINIKVNILLFVLTLFVFGCIEPNKEDLWSISIDGLLETNGFARDVRITEGKAYVAAGQSGIQIWSLEQMKQLNKYEEFIIPFATDHIDYIDLALVDLDTLNKLIFLSESNQDVSISYYGDEDTLIYYNEILSSRTKDFVLFPAMSGRFVLFAADNDDGMKWSIFDYDENVDGLGNPGYRPTFPAIEFAELQTPGKPLGIDSDGSRYIAMAVDQLGVELYSIDSLGSIPVLVGKIDTDGNAESVCLKTDGIYVACDDAGAAFIPIASFSSGNNLYYRFAEDLTVDHVAVNGNIAALSLGSKGIALYDISDPTSPSEKGIFPIGYTYRSEFWGNKLVVCSREGLQVLTIEQ